MQGPKGATGDRGIAGPQSIQGTPGSKGDKGDKGDTGSQGDVGAVGISGTSGANGKDGATILAGFFNPADSEGRDDDLYFDQENGEVYKKTSGYVFFVLSMSWLVLSMNRLNPGRLEHRSR